MLLYQPQACTQQLQELESVDRGRADGLAIGEVERFGRDYAKSGDYFVEVMADLLYVFLEFDHLSGRVVDAVVSKQAVDVDNLADSLEIILQ